MKIYSLCNALAGEIEKARRGETVTVQVSPFGDWPNGDVMQHVTKDAVQEIVAKWKDEGGKEILVDFDHDAESGASTVAAAWATNLRVDDERGLLADFHFTDKGEEAVRERRYRFLSPCWECKVDAWKAGEEDEPSEVTPVRLVSIALTNKPNIPVAPLLNREPPDVKSVERKKESIMDLTKIIEALGLAADATEADVLEALAKIKAENEECCRAKAEAEQAAKEKEADEFAAANEKKCNREVVRKLYLENKEATIALVNAIRVHTETPATVCNKATAKRPSFADAVENTDEAILAAYENMSPGEAKDAFLMANAVSINRARNARATAE